MDLRKLYPNAAVEQLKEYEENVLRYLEVVWRIYQRVRKDPAAYAQWQALNSRRLELRFKPGRKPFKTNTLPEKKSPPA